MKVRCVQCNCEFERESKEVAKNERRKLRLFCSRRCNGNFKSQERKGKTLDGKDAPRTVSNCAQCGITIERTPSHIKNYKNVFCNHSCATRYQNAHKTTGCRRSKLEKWLEIQLNTIFFDQILYNDKTTINSELDIYLPYLGLAFELNGIFHYEPIYGKEKLNQIQNNDTRKFQACLERGIELCIIDTSQFKYFKEEKAKIFLNIILETIKAKKETASL